MNRFLLILALVSSFGISAMAAEAGRGGSGMAGQGYSPGGTDSCGLGWQVTDKKTWMATTTRATTNAFIPPTFGMTTGTIGCEKHEIAKNEMEGAAYAFNNMDSLSVDLAMGQGEYLNGLARSMGCSAAAVPAMGEAMRANYRNIMTTEHGSALEVYSNIKSTIRTTPALVSACAV